MSGAALEAAGLGFAAAAGAFFAAREGGTAVSRYESMALGHAPVLRRPRAEGPGPGQKVPMRARLLAAATLEQGAFFAEVFCFCCRFLFHASLYSGSG